MKINFLKKKSFSRQKCLRGLFNGFHHRIRNSFSRRIVDNKEVGNWFQNQILIEQSWFLFGDFRHGESRLGTNENWREEELKDLLDVRQEVLPEKLEEATKLLLLSGREGLFLVPLEIRKDLHKNQRKKS